MKSYKMLRPCLWFARGEVIMHEKFALYYTSHAINNLLSYKFIEEV